MSKDFNTLIVGGEKNTTKWKKNNNLYPSVSLVIEKEKNIFIKGVKVLNYSMHAF
jgi:hypothetical protein